MEPYGVRRIKGDIVEVICRNHFAAMGFGVENAGVEHFAAKFANRPNQLRGDADDSNVGKIQNYIGQLPDLLVGHDLYDYYFVEAKFRKGIDITTFAKELLWNYRKSIFGRDFNSQIFDKITRQQWDLSKDAYDFNQEELVFLDKFFECLNSKRIDAEEIRVPILFYALIKQEKNFSLYLTYFDEEIGSFQIHQAGNAADMKSTDVRMMEIINLFDKAYRDIVVPILNEMFSANIDATPLNNTIEAPLAIESGSILNICISSARNIKKIGRHGVYFTTLLKEENISAWLKKKGLPVAKESLKFELEKCGLGRDRKMFEFEGEEIPIRINEYSTDFDFYLK